MRGEDNVEANGHYLGYSRIISMVRTESWRGVEMVVNGWSKNGSCFYLCVNLICAGVRSVKTRSI